MGRSRTAWLEDALLAYQRHPLTFEREAGQRGPRHGALTMIAQLVDIAEGNCPDQILSLHRPEPYATNRAHDGPTRSRRVEPVRPGDGVRRFPLHPWHHMRIPMEGELRRGMTQPLTHDTDGNTRLHRN